MKIFLAGATGALGKRLLPQLVTRGHHIIATTRTPAKADALRMAGAEPAVFDALDREAVMKAVASARPDVVVHQMTALANVRNYKKFDKEFTLTNRLRTEGTEYLLTAARAAGVRRFLAQSYTGWPNVRSGGRVKTEQDPLDPNPPKAMQQSLQAIRQLEAMVSGASDVTGIVLRYGSFYGPGTSLGPAGEIVELVRQRKFPIVGGGAGVWSFIHIDDASSATRIAIEGGPAGIYNIVDDEPAEVSVWLPDLARVLGAKPPRHLPAWLGRLVIGETVVSMMTSVRGSSNSKAKQMLNWQPGYASWRDGFRGGFAGKHVDLGL
ncbi:MAG: NAD-dependent epimerase/dehydratase family protein [Bryobacteraceae bacterium]